MQRSMANFLQQYLRALLEQDDNAETDEEDVVMSDDEDGNNSSSSSNNNTSRQTRQLSQEEQIHEYQRVLQDRKKTLLDNDISMIINRHCNSLRNNNNYRLPGYASTTASIRNHHNCNIVLELNRRRLRQDKFTRPEKISLSHSLLPNFNNGSIDRYNDHEVFCGQFSDDGKIFMSACQDQIIRLYDFDHITYSTARGKRAKPFKGIHARDVGWNVVGADYSPDRKFIIYSSWSPFVHLAAVDTTSDYHEALDLDPGSMRFCAFSVKFSPDSREVLAGGSDNHMYLYDLETKRRVLRVNAHTNDVNTVCFADRHAHVFYSGSDDGYCKVWDRRVLNSSDDDDDMSNRNRKLAKPVGVLVGHSQGITCISSRNDERYLISNGKDQALKLWDLRMIKNYDDQIPKISDQYRFWDYRHTSMPSRYAQRLSKHDTSLMTYTGHRVLRTLIRCYFSPLETTGQRYIYTGSADGIVYIYDVLTGDIVHKLVGHSSLVRDVSWHPYSNDLLSTSWDSSVIHWSYRAMDEDQMMSDEEEIDEEGDDAEADEEDSPDQVYIYTVSQSDDDDEDEEDDDDVDYELM
jgi:WD repeat-containing protein 23